MPVLLGIFKVELWWRLADKKNYQKFQRGSVTLELYKDLERPVSNFLNGFSTKHETYCPTISFSFSILIVQSKN